MRQGITTKYLGPTNSRGSRVKAIARKTDPWLGAEISLTDNWDCASNSEENHTRAAQMLATKLELSGLWVAGGAPDNSGNMYVCHDWPADVVSAAKWIGTEGRDWFYVPASPAA